MCVSIGGSNQLSKTFTAQKDTNTHIYGRPGTYRITATAGSVFSGIDTWKPSQTGTVKGAKKLTKTITVTSPDSMNLTTAEKTATLTPGAQFNDRTSVVKLINALDWEGLWTIDVALDNPAATVTGQYDLTENGVGFATFRITTPTGSYVKVLNNKPGSLPGETSYFSTFQSEELPAGGNVEDSLSTSEGAYKPSRPLPTGLVCEAARWWQ
jgi:hypothetical protein